MDNFKIDIVSMGDDELRQALVIAFAHAGDKAEGYMIDPEKGLIFFSYMGSSSATAAAVKLPFKLDAVGGADFARRWLAEQDYGREPDHDGSNSKGWRVYNESWGRIGDMWGAFIAIKPNWAWHGK